MRLTISWFYTNTIFRVDVPSDLLLVVHPGPAHVFATRLAVQPEVLPVAAVGRASSVISALTVSLWHFVPLWPARVVIDTFWLHQAR